MPFFHTKSTANGSLTPNQTGLYNQRLFKFKAFRFNHSLPLCWGLEPNHMSVTCQSNDKIAPFLSTESRLQSILWSMLGSFCIIACGILFPECSMNFLTNKMWFQFLCSSALQNIFFENWICMFFIFTND